VVAQQQSALWHFSVPLSRTGLRYPRFKSRDRFSGFGFKTHGDGFRFDPGANWKHGKLFLSRIGTMRARGEASQDTGASRLR
jgi:hypothetical protein